jgi:hypothetical protein
MFVWSTSRFTAVVISVVNEREGQWGMRKGKGVKHVYSITLHISTLVKAIFSGCEIFLLISLD